MRRAAFGCETLATVYVVVLPTPTGNLVGINWLPDTIRNA